MMLDRLVSSILSHIDDTPNYHVRCDSNSPYGAAIRIAVREGWVIITSKERINDHDYHENNMPIRYKYYLELTEAGQTRLRYDEL